METRMTSQSSSGEGAAFTAIQSLQLKFCKIAPQGDCFFIQKACSPAGWREWAPFNSPTKPGIQQVWGSCFPAGFNGRGGQPASPADTKHFPKTLGMEGWVVQRWAGVTGGKGVLGEGSQRKYAPGFRSRAGLGVSGQKMAGMCGYVMPGVWQGNLVLPGDGKSLEVLMA